MPSSISIPPDQTSTPGQRLSRAECYSKARWIRDTLDPRIVLEGARFVKPLELIELHVFLNTLLHMDVVSIEDILSSRIHKALTVIAAPGSRWPLSLIELCDAIKVKWCTSEDILSIAELREHEGSLTEEGGRLYGYCEESQLHDLNVSRSGAWSWRHCTDRLQQSLAAFWLNDPQVPASRHMAWRSGHLDFRPGAWWIHPVFAFHDGIIDNPGVEGGISSNGKQAFAVVLSGRDVMRTIDRKSFVYRIKTGDPGGMSLVNAILPPKKAVRVLRYSTSNCELAPVKGIRYDGLYHVAGYTLHTIQNRIRFDVTLQRVEMEPRQTPMSEVVRHPLAEELDDYDAFEAITKSLKSYSERSCPIQETKVPYHVRLASMLMGDAAASSAPATPSTESDQLGKWEWS